MQYLPPPLQASPFDPFECVYVGENPSSASVRLHKDVLSNRSNNVLCRACAVRCTTPSFIGRRFQKTPLRGPLSKTCVFGARKSRLHVDGRLTRRKNIYLFLKISEYVWTGSKRGLLLSFSTDLFMREY